MPWTVFQKPLNETWSIYSKLSNLLCGIYRLHRAFIPRLWCSSRAVVVRAENESRRQVSSMQSLGLMSLHNFMSSSNAHTRHFLFNKIAVGVCQSVSWPEIQLLRLLKPGMSLHNQVVKIFASLPCCGLYIKCLNFLAHVFIYSRSIR